MFRHTNDPFILSPLEHAGPRGYVRPILCFALDPSADQDEVVRILKDGLDATKEQVPYLSAQVVPDTEAEQKGCLTLRDGDFGELRVKSLSKDEFPLSYAEFRAQNFPTDLLHQDVVSPTHVFPSPGSPVPVFLAQANFVDGGLLLSIAVYHLVADGFSICKLLQLWAQSCRRLQDPAAAPTVFLSSSAFERAPLVVGHLSDPDKCDIADHPHLELTAAPPPNRMPSTARPYRTHIWHLTPDALQRLRHDASASSSHKVSAADALTALLWRATAAAQNRNPAAIDPAALSILTIPVASRARTFPPLAPDYMGCPLVYANPSHPLAAVVGDATTALLPTLAQKVKTAVAAITPHHVSSVVNVFNKVPDYACLAPASFAGLGGPHVLVSSWERYDAGAYGEAWGALFGGACERVRTAREGVMNGVQLVLPALPGGGVEVAVGLEVGGAEEALARDEVWARYAVRVA